MRLSSIIFEGVLKQRRDLVHISDLVPDDRGHPDGSADGVAVGKQCSWLVVVETLDEPAETCTQVLLFGGHTHDAIIVSEPLLSALGRSDFLLTGVDFRIRVSHMLLGLFHE
jgi:hypothetical protein